MTKNIRTKENEVIKARDEMIKANLRLVVSIAKNTTVSFRSSFRKAIWF